MLAKGCYRDKQKTNNWPTAQGTFDAIKRKTKALGEQSPGCVGPGRVVEGRRREASLRISCQ